MNKIDLALSRCDELERLVRKNKKTTSQQEPETEIPETKPEETTTTDKYRKDMQEVVFGNAAISGSQYFYTNIYELPPGLIAFRVGGDIECGEISKYHVELYCNDILLYATTKETVAQNEVLHVDFVACTYIYEKHNKLTLHIYEDQQIVSFGVSNFKLIFNPAEVLTQGNFTTHIKTQEKAHIFTAAVHDGLNKDGVYQKKYAYAIREGSGIKVGECDADNFAFGQESAVSFNTYDNAADFGIQYNIVPSTASAPITYRYLVLLYPCTSSNYYYYKNISTNSNFSASRLLKGTCMQTAAATKDSASYYLAATLLSDGRVGLNYLKTNVLGETETTFSTGNWSDVKKLALTKTYNLTQAVKAIPLVLLRENKLYTVLDKTIGPILVNGISESIEDISDSVFISDDSMDIYVYVKVNGYLKKYLLACDQGSGAYTLHESVVIGYGISEFMPLLNGDAFLAYGNSFYYTDKVDRFLC